MYKLYLDTSTKYLCIGVSKDDVIIKKIQIDAERKQSELTIPYLSELLNEINLTLKEINEVVVTIGPGSFTGIRIGMCIAKVLASVNNIPLIALSSLNCYANAGKKIVILDAKASRCYLGIYNDNVPVIDECVVTLEELNNMLNDYADYEVVLDSHLINKTSSNIDVIENMVRISKNTLPVINVDSLVPIYLKDR